MSHTWITPARSAAMALTAMLALAACSTAATPDPESSTTATPGETLIVTDAWVKAEDEGMTAAFGTLENPTDTDLEVVAVTSPAATAMQLHETVMDDDGQMVMHEVDAFTIPAGGSAELAPGGDHLMFMGLTEPIAAGDDVEITLALADGSEVVFVAVAKDYEGANETYDDQGSDDQASDSHGDMDH